MYYIIRKVLHYPFEKKNDPTENATKNVMTISIVTFYYIIGQVIILLGFIAFFIKFSVILKSFC